MYDPKKLRMTRNVTQAECKWLDRDLKEGEVVFEYDGHTYGCVTPTGVAVTMQRNKLPFFEVPGDSVKASK